MLDAIYYGPPQGAPFFDFEVIHTRFMTLLESLVQEGIASGEFRPVLMKKFLSHLHAKTTAKGKPLSPKRIHNTMIPLRVIVKDACGEYGWGDLPEPFAGLKLPKVKRIRIHPFTLAEWAILMEVIPVWYRPYFQLAVQTGLRPSEQVALKWDAIDDRFIHIELSRVRNQEKSDLKTPESNRRIEIRSSLRKILEEQKKQTANYQSPYIFINGRQTNPPGQTAGIVDEGYEKEPAPPPENV